MDLFGFLLRASFCCRPDRVEARSCMFLCLRYAGNLTVDIHQRPLSVFVRKCADRAEALPHLLQYLVGVGALKQVGSSRSLYYPQGMQSDRQGCVGGSMYLPASLIPRSSKLPNVRLNYVLPCRVRRTVCATQEQ